MKHNFKKVMSLLFILAMMLTFVPVQKISADDTFTLELSKSIPIEYKIESLNTEFQRDSISITNVPFDKKITLKINITDDEEAKWFSTRVGNGASQSDPIDVYEGEDLSGKKKSIENVRTNIISFTMTTTPEQTNIFLGTNKTLRIQADKVKKAEKPSLILVSDQDSTGYFKNGNFEIHDVIKEFNLTKYLYIKGATSAPKKDELTNIEWESKNPEVFTIKDGVFRPKTNGESTVTFRAIYNKEANPDIQKGTLLEGKIKVVVQVPQRKLLISNDYTLPPSSPGKSVPVGAITKVEYTDVPNKTFLAWHAKNEESNLDIVDEQGESTGKMVENIEPGQKSFYIIMPNTNVLFAPSFQDLDSGKELKILKNADAKLLTRFSKNLPTPKEVQQGNKLQANDIIEVRAKESHKFKAWQFKGLELSTGYDNTSSTAKFKVLGTEDIEIKALYQPANSESKTVSGTKGEQLNNTIIITLENMYFKDIAIGQDLKLWFVKPIQGLEYTSNTKAEAANNVTQLVIKISGTPTVASSENIFIKIPAEFLSTNTEQEIINPLLKYDIKEKSDPPASQHPSPREGSNNDSNSGSGTSSKVEKITDKNKTQKPKPEDEKKLQEKKTEEKKPQTSEKLKETMTDQKVIKVGDVEIQKVFEDVKQDDWFATSVAFVKEMNLINGTQEMKFSPQEKTTRAMLVTILYRLAGTPMTEEKASFSDVKGDEYFAQAISWASKSGIVKGYETGAFGTNDNITREQLAVILYNYAVNAKKEIANTADIKKFNDIDSISNYAIEAMNWTVSTGIIRGKGNQLDPKANATRAEVATMIMRFAEFLK